MVIACGLAEITRYAAKCNSFFGNALSYFFFSYDMIGSLLPIWLFRDSFLAQIANQGMPADYVSSFASLSSTPLLIVLLVTPLIGALLGVLIAKILFKKHFEKAGIV